MPAILSRAKGECREFSKMLLDARVGWLGEWPLEHRRKFALAATNRPRSKRDIASILASGNAQS